ncbi:hypothetical protein BP6252_06630 [Coleophoma cylindrospora]|uniref:Uncharacterized protein n=1 Tax=Coleophoma cylindrospora TaxID=1849047 RepID=A0A3D8RNG3_9HELO|nr:hypothetical protein BP6252_06630 [Coleophoma cylindrospora]
MSWTPFGNSSRKVTTGTQLANEISKVAKLGNVQNGLPGAMRVIPVAAIVAGNVYAKVVAKDGENLVEKALLKDDGAIMGLQAPGGSREDGPRGNGEGEEAARGDVGVILDGRGDIAAEAQKEEGVKHK